MHIDTLPRALTTSTIQSISMQKATGGMDQLSIRYGISKDLTVNVVVVEAKSGTMATSGVA
ncbi:hypothetical protein N7455_000340 [Penicillium solitum]|uniref:uncharacterized protein n=1 Tax=Penicillium solitum TaxID=60172 RepID=UPI0032C44536|nr:hypothetical protein N7455_000340 [Penicillium solitum]